MPNGHPAIYVRTEKRYGDDEPSHLFVVVHDRTVFEAWHATCPEDYDVQYEPRAHCRAVRLEIELARSEHKSSARLGALRHAISLVTDEQATAIRRAYTDATSHAR